MTEHGELFEKLPDGVTLHDPADGAVLATNQQFCAMLGYTREELLALDFDDLHVNEEPYTSERARQYIRLASEEGPQTFEWRDETKDGEALPVEVHLRGTEIDGEERILAVVRDITERIHQEERFRAFIDHSMDIITVLDGEGRFVYQSPSLKRWLGYEPAELLGESSFEYVHPEDRETVRRSFSRGLRDSAAKPSVEYRFRHRDGSWRWLESIGSTQLDNPAIEGVVVNSRDITARKRHEQRMSGLHDVTRELMEVDSIAEMASVAAETVTTLLDLPHSAVYLYDESTDRLEPAATSEETAEVLGSPPSFDLDEGIAGRVYGTGSREIHADVREEPAVKNPETPMRSEMVFPLDDHGVFLVASTAVDDFDDEDVALAGVLAANLITALDRAAHGAELERRSRELERQNERLDNFASFISHDLRNPLSVARSRFELVQDDCESPHMEDVRQAHERIEGLIDDLLRLAREGDAVEDRKPVALGAVAESSWQSLATEDAHLQVAADRQILADPGRLQPLVTNLLQNAVDHGGEAVTVTVGDLRDGFYVADDGPGIPPADRERVFESGYSSQVRGTGIGLSLVREIASAHGWDVSVSDSEAGGARFEITGVESMGASGHGTESTNTEASDHGGDHPGE